MFCQRCGFSLEDDMMFCPNCGSTVDFMETTQNTELPTFVSAPTDDNHNANDTDNHSVDSSFSPLNPTTYQTPVYTQMPAKRKSLSFLTTIKDWSKKKKIIVSIISSLVLILIIGSIIFLSWYNAIDQKILRAFKDGDYDEALSIYSDSYESEDEEALTKAMKKRLSEIEVEFANDRMEYSVALMELDTMRKMEIDSLSASIDDTQDYIDELNDSKTSFKTAEAFFADGNYREAIINYRLVIKDDPNYETATTNLPVAIEKFRSQTIEKADSYAANEDYVAAISIIDNALEVLPGDSVLTEKLNLYQSENALKIKNDSLSAASKYADAGDYENAIKTIQAAMTGANESDPDLNAALSIYSGKYVDSIITDVDSMTANRDYTGALNKLTAAQNLLPENEVLANKYAEVDAAKPISLFELTPVNYSGSWLNKESILEDALGNEYYDCTNYFVPYEDNYGEYYINGKYSAVSGKLTSWHEMESYDSNCFQIYADDVLIYTSQPITRKTIAFDFHVNLPVNTQYVTFMCISDHYYSKILITDIMLWKS